MSTGSLHRSLDPAGGSALLREVDAPRPIDIIVPVYKSVALTTACLKSLVANIAEIAAYSPRLVIINDSPAESDVDEMLAVFRADFPAAKFITNDRNRGFVATANRGLALACEDGHDALLVNADTETYPGTLANLVAAAYSDPQIGFASPRSNNASLCSLPHFHGGVPPDKSEAYRRWRLLSETMPALHYVPTVVGFYMLVKHKVLANFGLLHEEFGVGYEEENDLVLRANKAGYRAVLVNNAFAYHAGSASFSLTGIDLTSHRSANLRKLAAKHPEFLPLVHRYESSPHYRAEAMLGHLLPVGGDRISIVFDLSNIGSNFNGTNEMTMAIIDSLCRRHSASLDINVICSHEAFEFHKLKRHPQLQWHDSRAGSAQRFAVGVRLAQPFDLHALNKLEDLAAVNVFGMLDTIAEDCGYLSTTHRLGEIWGHAARHANGLFFISKFSEKSFLARFPEAKRLARFARLLSTSLRDYKNDFGAVCREHVLVMGNHFAHKASEVAAAIIRESFPTVQLVVMGTETYSSGNVIGFRSGTLRQVQIESLVARASVVVLPSHVEGFGFGVVHALAARKVIVARNIAATREILCSYRSVSGVHLFDDDAGLVAALRKAMDDAESSVDDAGSAGWDEWVDGFVGFCLELLQSNDLFERLKERIRAGDLLRQAGPRATEQAAGNGGAPPAESNARSTREGESEKGSLVDGLGRVWHAASSVSELLELQGSDFVCRAYVTLFRRFPDAEGMENYLQEMKNGISKFEVISRLKNSREGRKADASLDGYWLERLRRKFLPWVSRG